MPLLRLEPPEVNAPKETPPKPPVNLEPPAVPVIVVPLEADGVTHALVFARDLRRAGIGCTVDMLKGKFGKKLERAGKARVYYVAILGPDEIVKDHVTFRDMDEKSNETLPRVDAITKLLAELLTEDERRVAARRQAVAAYEASGA